MAKVKTCILFCLLFSCTNIFSQKLKNLLIEQDWLAYDNFAKIDFLDNNEAVIEYVYCTYCRGNVDTVNWSLDKRLLVIGKDSLSIKSSSKTTIQTEQYGQKFELKNLAKAQSTKLQKSEIQQFLLSSTPLSLKIANKKALDSQAQSIQFLENGQMWVKESKYRGQWALKSFYGELFLIYINRYAVDRNFPVLKIKRLEKDNLITVPIQTVQQGSPFEYHIY